MSKSILIIDDDPLVLQFTHLVLGQAGYAVTTAKSGELALSVLSHARPSLVLLDIDLPDMTGLKVLEILRRHRCLTMPIVMMTAKKDAPTVQAALRNGASGYITKPFTPAALRERVEALLAPAKPQVPPHAPPQAPPEARLQAATLAPAGPATFVLD